jgi:enediyne biosynthesis protein E4
MEAFGTEAGVAYSAAGARQAGMGTDFGDYDNDGWLDLVVATYEGEIKPVYQNQGDSLFTDQSARLGVAAPLMPYIAFGVKWIDADNDGWLDLIFTNGHIADNIQEHLKHARFRQPSVFLRNAQGKRFEKAALPALDTPLVGRGIAVGDYDNDGRVDALLVDSDGEPLLLHNQTTNAGSYLTVALTGTKSSRDAYGAEVEITVGGRRLVRHCHTDGSYLSASDARVHFGLGKAKRVDRVRVRWPSGAETVRTNLPVNQQIALTEGS